MANGITLTVACRGNVLLTSSLKLENVLHLPKLTTNLISIQRLAKDLSCKVTFSNEFYLFQDQISRRKVGATRVEIATSS